MLEPVTYDFGAIEDEPRSAKPYLDAILEAERQFQRYQHKADRIDKLYSSLQTLSGMGLGVDGRLDDREYNLFWASVEVIKPSIYSRPPVPVVTTKFKDRNPVKRTTAELLERSVVSGFDISDIDQVMLSVRDDLVIVARGVIWVTYEDEGSDEKVCIEHIDRTDFIHEPVRKWADVGWVARRAWLSRREMEERFGKEAVDSANFSTRKEDDTDGARSRVEQAGVWEVWHKAKNKVIWVTEGCEEVLDMGDPHLKLQGFFPCPRPAYGTLQRRTLVPVPDISYIEDQLETINELTMRIHDLCDKLVVKGIVPAGTDVGDALEAALRETDASYMLIPVPAMSMTDGAAVQWLPIEQVAQAILAAVEARRELIGNVQELFGIADIMRGESEAAETAKAQTLKAQYGSVRIRDRVNELIRIARDTVQIMAEIMAEEFSFDTLMTMSQMELPTDADVKREMKLLEKSARQELTALVDKAEEVMQGQQEIDPQQAQQQLQQAQQEIIGKYQPQIEKLSQSVTVEMVRDLLRDDKIRPFVFDIETDSTIYPDEMAEKQSRNEFMQVFVTASQALAPLAMSGPAGAKLAGGLIKFQLGPYRAGRELDGMIDEWVESLENMPQQPNPDAEKNAAEAEYKKGMLALEGQKLQQEGQFRQSEIGLKEQELQLKAAEIQMKPQLTAQTEQIKQEGNARAKELDAQVAVTREQAQLDADMQTATMGREAEAALEAQRAQAESAEMILNEQFRRDELAQRTALEWAKLDQQAADAEANRMAAAMKPNGGNDA